MFGKINKRTYSLKLLAYKLKTLFGNGFKKELIAYFTSL
jgi:hypothetical protein